jgi:hypothetical protein
MCSLAFPWCLYKKLGVGRGDIEERRGREGRGRERRGVEERRGRGREKRKGVLSSSPAGTSFTCSFSPVPETELFLIS